MSTPIRIHPQNPKLFEFRGEPLVLLTATEHYGAVMNRPFRFDRYLADTADKGITFAVILGISIPSFFLGMMMILVFAVNLRMFPVSGMWPIYGDRDLEALIRHLTLPALTLSVVATGVIARLSRSAMLEVLRADYIRTARAKGLRESRVVWLHALKTAMVSILPILGLQAGFVLSGAVYIEMVFQWPGVGRMLVDAILKRDIMLVQGGVVFVASCYVLFNIIVDVLQTLLDSRIKT